MGYWVSSEPEHFLEGMFFMDKYEFFLFPTVQFYLQNFICTALDVTLHLLKNRKLCMNLAWRQ
jgi:hypothetical protein